jgi:hypothetical protein
MGKWLENDWKMVISWDFNVFFAYRDISMYFMDTLW